MPKQLSHKIILYIVGTREKYDKCVIVRLVFKGYCDPGAHLAITRNFTALIRSRTFANMFLYGLIQHIINLYWLMLLCSLFVVLEKCMI